MSYTPGVTDRTAADILAKNSKAYFNIADWNRIYDNTSYLNGVLAALGITVPFTTITTPTTATHCTALMLNTLLTNINNLWTVPGFTITGVTALRTDWVGGVPSDKPTYVDVNLWEHTLDLLNTFISSLAIVRWPVTGFAIAGAGMTRQSSWRD